MPKSANQPAWFWRASRELHHVITTSVVNFPAGAQALRFCFKPGRINFVIATFGKQSLHKKANHYNE
jgi:hypothetical protein